ncbi:MAG: NADH-binding protein, partial [Anaeromyxobacteraceae bacterium]
MGPQPRFHERDLAAAGNFAAAARAAGVRRIVYLGGLGDDAGPLSAHLASRHATGEALRQGGVPVTELRAAIIVGAGSLSFEMIRSLAERLPLMLCPRWVYTRVQPIAIRDVLDYLVAALGSGPAAGQVVEIGGA